MKVPIEEAKKLLSAYSPLLLLAEKLRLKYLTKEGKFFTGPSPEFAVLVDKATEILPIKTMLDLFCGTGALAKIALGNGVEKVVCIDKDLSAAKANLGGGIEFIEKDVFEVEFFYKADLALIDAPRYLLKKVLEELVPKLKKCKLLFVWCGNVEEELSFEVKQALKKEFKKVVGFSIWGSEIAGCASKQIGIKWLNLLLRKW